MTAINQRVLICISLLIAGLVVLAWPEEDNVMMIQFSGMHGPSGLDLIGLGIILAGYFPIIIPVFTRFTVVQQSIGKRLASYLVATCCLFSVLIAAGLLVESEPLLWSSVAVAAGAQAVLVYAAFRKAA